MVQTYTEDLTEDVIEHLVAAFRTFKIMAEFLGVKIQKIEATEGFVNLYFFDPHPPFGDKELEEKIMKKIEPIEVSASEYKEMIRNNG